MSSFAYKCGKCNSRGGLYKETNPLTKIPEIHCRICGNIWWRGGKTPEPIMVNLVTGEQHQKQTIETKRVTEKPKKLWEKDTDMSEITGRTKKRNRIGTCSNCLRTNQQIAIVNPQELCAGCYNALLRKTREETREEVLAKAKIKFQKKEAERLQLSKDLVSMLPGKLTNKDAEKIAKELNSGPAFIMSLSSEDAWLLEAYPLYCKDQRRTEKEQFSFMLEQVLSPYRNQVSKNPA